MCVAIQIVGHKFHATYVSIQERLTALMEATNRGHKNIVKALLDGKADTNITDEVGWCTELEVQVKIDTTVKICIYSDYSAHLLIMVHMPEFILITCAVIKAFSRYVDDS
jgi:hypothetical protein